MNKVNLQKMADYIKTIPQQSFDMSIYREEYNYYDPECESVGCIIGHCTIIDKENVKANYVDDLSGEIDFHKWSEQFTGLKSISPEWNFLFSMDWKDVDNSIKGAVQRLEYIISGCKVSEWSKTPLIESIKLYFDLELYSD